MLDYKVIIEHKEFIYNLIAVSLLGFFLTTLAIPEILKISYRKRILNTPNKRSSHKKEIPHLGGVAIFYSLMICSSIFIPELSNYKFLYAALIILFFAGLLDDFSPLKANSKLFIQIITALFITVGSDVRIKSFFGIMGIYELNYYLSIVFSILVFITIINSYNLIDGIDGLAGSVGIIAFIAFFYSFFRLREYSLAILCILLAASLIAFLRFNFSKKRKIFMGDTGSMLIGYLLSFMAIKFIDLCSESYVHFNNSPAIAVAILIVPISDTINVSVLRLINGVSIFKADKRHIHHKLLRLKLSHIQATSTISLAYVFILLVAYYFRNIEIHLLLSIILGLGFLLSIGPNIITFFLSKEKKL